MLTNMLKTVLENSTGENRKLLIIAVFSLGICAALAAVTLTGNGMD